MNTDARRVYIMANIVSVCINEQGSASLAWTKCGQRLLNAIADRMMLILGDEKEVAPAVIDELVARRYFAAVEQVAISGDWDSERLLRICRAAAYRDVAESLAP